MINFTSKTNQVTSFSNSICASSVHRFFEIVKNQHITKTLQNQGNFYGRRCRIYDNFPHVCIIVFKGDLLLAVFLMMAW